MDDTSPDIAKKLRELIQEKSPLDRLKMSASMYETSKTLVARDIWEDSAAHFRQELFLKFYGNDFDSVARQKILDHLGPASLPSRTRSHDEYQFEHISSTERAEDWFRLLYPLIQARLLRGKLENSRLLKVLNLVNGIRTWKSVKHSIETVLTNVRNGERILARTAEIKKSPDPDGIIDDMFAEIRTVPYLLIKGFKNITYCRRNGLDFVGEFEGNIFHIESTYVHGPDFKTQEMFSPKSQIN